MGKVRNLRPSVSVVDVRTAAPLPTAGSFSDPRRGSAASRGYDRTWRTLRLQILKRDRYRCQCEECKAALVPKPARDVDHIVAKGDGGSDDPANLQSMNPDCHAIKTARENAARRQGGGGHLGLAAKLP